MERVEKLNLTKPKIDFHLKQLLPLLGLILVSVLFHYWSGESFLTPRNLSNLSRQICVQTTLAVGMTLIILTSGIDLSVGSVLALSGMIAAISQVHWGFSTMGLSGAFFSALIALAVGASTGGLTGFAVSKLKITPFIVSLGMMVICRGLTLIFSKAQAVAPLGSSLESLSSDYMSPTGSLVLFATICIVGVAYKVFQFLKKEIDVVSFGMSVVAFVLGTTFLIYVFCGYRGIPIMVFLAAFCAIFGYVLLKFTRFGRFLYAIGGNKEAALLSGVPVDRTLWVTYFIMGCLAALAGLMDCARVNGAVPSAGELAELDAIAAVVIGGTSLMGGQGGVLGTLFGVLILGVLNNGMSLVGISEHYQKVFKGVVIITAVYLDLRSKKR